jgi:hypothetical protein
MPVRTGTRRARATLLAVSFSVGWAASFKLAIFVAGHSYPFHHMFDKFPNRFFDAFSGLV